MRRTLLFLIMSITILSSGCEKHGDIGEKEPNPPIEKENPIKEEDENLEHEIPESIIQICGMTIEEQIDDFTIGDPEHYCYNKVEANDSGGITIFSTKTQCENYKQEIIKKIQQFIEEAYQKEDIEVKTSDDCREIKFVMGEESNSDGFMVTAIKILSQVGVWQILNGCKPEEWGFHFVVEKEAKTIMDVNIPEDKWTLTNEDFGE